eukprot:gene9686-biopygen10759
MAVCLCICSRISLVQVVSFHGARAEDQGTPLLRCWGVPVHLLTGGDHTKPAMITQRAQGWNVGQGVCRRTGGGITAACGDAADGGVDDSGSGCARPRTPRRPPFQRRYRDTPSSNLGVRLAETPDQTTARFPRLQNQHFDRESTCKMRDFALYKNKPAERMSSRHPARHSLDSAAATRATGAQIIRMGSGTSGWRKRARGCLIRLQAGQRPGRP